MRSLPLLLAALVLAGGAASAFPLTTSDPIVTRVVDLLAGRGLSSGCIRPIGSTTCTAGTTREALLALSGVVADPASFPPGAATASLSFLRSRAADIQTEPTFCQACKWAKAVVTLAGLGEDPRTFGGVDHVAPLDAEFDGVQVGSESQINDDLWALFAYAAAGEDSQSEKVRTIRQYVEARQGADGGWAWNLGLSTTWATATALLSLRAHGASPSDLALTRAADFLHLQQEDSGLMREGTEGASAESTAIAIQALDEMGQDPSGPNWTRNGQSLVSALLGLQQADGGFPHAPGQSTNNMATLQVLPALRAIPFPFRPPVVGARANLGEADPGQPVAFSCTASDPDGLVTSLVWDFGDGTGSPQASSSHSYAEPGTYPATCRATDDDGVVRTAILTIRVRTPAAATTTSSPSSRTTPTSPPSSSSPSSTSAPLPENRDPNPPASSSSTSPTSSTSSRATTSSEPAASSYPSSAASPTSTRTNDPLVGTTSSTTLFIQENPARAQATAQANAAGTAWIGLAFATAFAVILVRPRP